MVKRPALFIAVNDVSVTAATRRCALCGNCYQHIHPAPITAEILHFIYVKY